MEALSGIGRYLVRTPVVTAIVTAVAVLGGGIYVFAGNNASSVATEIFLEPAESLGANPFINLLRTPVPTVVLARDLLTDRDSTDVSSLTGSTVGLYGGTLSDTQCDREQMITFLTSNTVQGRAWAAAQGITLEQLPAYIRTLTPMQLRLDTRVTNHGFADGRATPLQSVLQAGTAVLVDSKGVPRARCACGNPLLAPEPAAKSSFVGEKWSGFDAKALVRVTSADGEISTFTLHDAATDTLFDRPAGTDGEADKARTGSRPVQKTTPPTKQAPSEPAAVSVPNLVNKTDAEASVALRQAGLQVAITYTQRRGTPPGTVVGQDPAAGTSVKAGSTVELTVVKQGGTSTTVDRVSVPDLSGMTDAGALAALRDAGLRATIDYAETSEITAGTVLGQSPAAGTTVNGGATVTVTVAQTPAAPPPKPPPAAKIKAPELVGMTEAAAIVAARDAQLAVTVTYLERGDVKAGTVLSQNPAAGTSVDPSSTVAIVVASEPGKPPPPPRKVVVPDLVGRSEANAINAARESELAPSVTYEDSADATAGTVLRQSLAASASVDPGSAIILTVATKSPPPKPTKVTVPGVIGQSEPEALSALKDAGLRASVSYVERSDVNGPTVVDQKPAGGASVDPGSTIALVVAKQPPPPSTVKVPNVVNLAEAVAYDTIKKNELIPEVTYFETIAAEPGVVMEQKPAGGTEVNLNTRVTMIVAKRPSQQQVPNFVEMTIEKARAVANDAGLKLAENGDNTNNYKCGDSSVFRQDPPAGKTIASGGVVSVYYLYGNCPLRSG